MKKYISKFHYLTQDLPHRSHIDQAQIACSSGANWVQYRCLTKPDEELVAEINVIAEICDDWGATLILTDHYHLLNRVDAQGVYIEDMRADLTAIRNQIGDDKTLGTSATNITRLLQLQQQSGLVDYIAYGPFAHTDTKPNDFALLGFEGYRQLANHAFELPVIAVGGIKIEDVDRLMQTNILGIAISGYVNLASEPSIAIKEFYRKIY